MLNEIIFEVAKWSSIFQVQVVFNMVKTVNDKWMFLACLNCYGNYFSNQIN